MSTAFSGIVKLLSELTEQTTAADTDVMPIGATSPRKITIANLKEALGIGALNRNIFYNAENQYCDFYCEGVGRIVKITFNTTVKKNIPVDMWTTIAVLPGYTAQRVTVDKNSTILGVAYTVQIDGGNVQIYPRGTMISAGDFIIHTLMFITN